MSNESRKTIVSLVALHQRVSDVVSRKYNPPVRKCGLRRLLKECREGRCALNDLIDLFEADCSSSIDEVKKRQKAHAFLLREATKDLLEKEQEPRLPTGTGNAIIEILGLSGLEVGKVMLELENLLLSGEINGKMEPKEIVEFYNREHYKKN